MRILPLTLASLVPLAACATAAAPARTDAAHEAVPTAATARQATPPARAGDPQIGTFGFDVAGMDRTIAPGESFYGYANGSWERTTEIPADQSNYGMFTMLADLSAERTRAILDEAMKRPGSRIGDMYASFMDEAAVEAKGAAPLQPWIERIGRISSAAEFAAVSGELLRDGIRGPLAFRVGQDRKAPDQYLPSISQSGLGLPDRDYYLKDDPKLVEARTAYTGYLARLLELAGEADAKARAAAVAEFERGLAEVHWTRVESRNADRTYNKMSWDSLTAMAPGFDWTAWAEGFGAELDTVSVTQPSAVTATAALIGNTPVSVLRDYLLVRTIDAAAPYLSSAFVNEEFAFNGTVLNGTPENRERWKRGVDAVTGALRDDVGREYVARHFPPEAKAAADELVRNVIAAMDRRLQNLAWMAPETKTAARTKLAAFTPKIGYPDRWRDYSGLEIRRDDLLGNVIAARRFEFDRTLGRLGGPVDRTEWLMAPMTVNAYASPTMNEIVFPAAILQAPFFDPEADPAINYGGIGAVIGHEISHHFDDQGRKYDPEGKLAEWWTPADVARFDSLAQRLVEQYDLYEPLPGMRVQGKLTLGENIADLAGLTVAYDAYRTSLGGNEPPVLDGFTGDQRFYLGWAQVWRRKYREENLRQRLLTDSHSPSEQRVAVVRNLDPWYDAFEPEPGEALHLAPAERVRIW
ncbi:MAG: M13 family metallopeptidase [Gemmatimonadota bacterium]|nr:M13 family metallopeptidase [Gemmatimonadota bacterium]